MTYKELISELQQLSDDQLNSNVVVYDEGTNELYQLKVKLIFSEGRPIIHF